MYKIVFLVLTTLCVSSASAQTVVGSFEENGKEITLLSDGRWGVVVESEVKCEDYPQSYTCLQHATEFSEEADLAPIDLNLKGVTFSDAGVFAGRAWGENSSDKIEIARRFVEQLSSVFNIPGGRVILLTTEVGTIRSHQYFRYEFLIVLDKGPAWSTVTRVKNGSHVADVGTHVFGEIWAISPEMLAVRKDFHNRVIQNLPLDWVKE